MSKRHWRIVAVTVGLAAIYGFGLGYYHAARNYPYQEGQPQYRYAADKPSGVDPALAAMANTKPLEYRRPCDNPKGETESDLCAQWRAAKAGEESALWAKWGFIISTIGSALLLWQIILTRKAVEDTGLATAAMRESNQIAREMSENQIRPWLAIEIIDKPRMIIANGLPQIKLKVKITNKGSSPAIQVTYFTDLAIGYEPHISANIAYSMQRKELFGYIADIFHEKHVDFEAIVEHTGEPAGYEIGFITIYVFYRTIFSDTLRTTAAFFQMKDRRNDDDLVDFSEPISSSDLILEPWFVNAGIID